MEKEEDRIIVLDNGTGYIKMGFAGDNFPDELYPSIVGRPEMKIQASNKEMQKLKAITIGREANKLRHQLKLTRPIKAGRITPGMWEDAELLWKYGFDNLGVNTKGKSIIITEAVMNPDKDREGMIEMLFEKFNFDKVYVGVQALMSLYAEGVNTACLLDSGDGVTHVIPVVEGCILN